MSDVQCLDPIASLISQIYRNSLYRFF